MGRGPEQTFLQGGYRGPRDIRKDIRITRHQGDVNYNHNEIPHHTGQNGHHNQINKQEVLPSLWKKGNPSTLLVGM